MSFLVVSNILLWAAVIGLGIVNYALLRQVGVLYERVAPAGALMVNRTFEVGVQAPALEALTLTEDRISIGGGAGSKSQLLFFVSPDCPVCNELMPALLFLLDPANSYMTGETLTIDGGMSASL